MNIEKRTFKGVSRYVKLYRVYDGDTIEIITKLDRFEKPKRYMFRLNGIDAPELKPKIGDVNRLLTIEAAEKIKTILNYLLTSVLYIKFDGEDKYGRLLGTLWTTRKKCCFFNSPDKNVNLWLLTNKLVLPYNGNKKLDFTKEWLVNNMPNINYIYNILRNT